jgi:hypothetical protein
VVTTGYPGAFDGRRKQSMFLFGSGVATANVSQEVTAQFKIAALVQ